MKRIIITILVVIILVAVYIFYARRIEAPESVPAPASNFQGPPPGAVPYVQGPTEPPPSSLEISN